MEMKNASDKSSYLNASIMIITAAILWGMLGLFTRSLYSEGFTAIQLTTFRCLITCIFLLLYILCTDWKKLKIKVTDLRYFFCMGLFSIVFFNICYFTTIRLSTLATASILLYTAPYFTVSISFLIFREPLTFRKTISLILSFLGCILAIGIDKGSLQVTTILFGLGSGFGYSLFSILGRAISNRYHPLTINFYTFMIAYLCIFPFSDMNAAIKLVSNHPFTIGNILPLGIVSTAIPFLLYTSGLKTVEAGKASIMAFTEPLVSSLIGVLIFKEPFTKKNLFGLLLITTSLCLLNSRKVDSHTASRKKDL